MKGLMDHRPLLADEDNGASNDDSPGSSLQHLTRQDTLDSITQTSNSPLHRPNASQSPVQHHAKYESLSGLLSQQGGISSPSFTAAVDDADGGDNDDGHNMANMSIMDDGSTSLDDDDRNSAGGSRMRGKLRYDSPSAIILGLFGICTLGTILGLIFPSSSSHSSTTNNIIGWDTLSNILGYTYFLSWTLSFYPQIITNWKYPTKAESGLSLDFVVCC